MRLVIIHAQAKQADAYLANAIQEFEESQTLAIVEYLRSHGKLVPTVICASGSLLERAAKKHKTPYFITEGLVNKFRLWQWLKAQDVLQILAIGENSLKLAKKIYASRKSESTRLNALFFLYPPSSDKAAQLFSCQQIICGSSYIADKITELFADKTKNKASVTICAPGMDLLPYNCPSSGYSGKGHFIFGMTGSLMPHSGAILTVRAMSALWQKNELSPWEVRMLGGGPRFNEILSEAENLGVASKLAILGNQPVAEAIKYCHVWLAPGSSLLEFPDQLWAGYAAGLPVIYSDDPLHRERVIYPEASLKVGVNNPQEMATAMIRLISDESLRNDLAKAGLRMRSYIGEEAMAARLYPLLADWKLGEEQNL